MSFNMYITDFMDVVNNETKTGSISFVTDIDECSFSEPHLPTDVAIFYDYCTDEIADSAFDSWNEWYMNMFDRLYQVMDVNGYKHVDENDGSGGGLYYGAILFRAK